MSENCQKIETERKNNGASAFLGGVRCISEKIKIPFDMKEDVYIYKQDLAYFVIFIDLMGVISIIIFLVIIKER